MLPILIKQLEAIRTKIETQREEFISNPPRNYLRVATQVCELSYAVENVATLFIEYLESKK